MRIGFSRKGEQRKFLKLVLERVNCPSIKVFEQFGLGINYSTMKNYFSEKRLLPEDLFNKMCYLAKLNISDFEFDLLDDNWGQVKGGKS